MASSRSAQLPEMLGQERCLASLEGTSLLRKWKKSDATHGNIVRGITRSINSLAHNSPLGWRLEIGSAGRDLNPRLYGFAGRSLGPLGHRRRDSQRTGGRLTGGLSGAWCGLRLPQ